MRFELVTENRDEKWIPVLTKINMLNNQVQSLFLNRIMQSFVITPSQTVG